MANGDSGGKGNGRKCPKPSAGEVMIGTVLLILVALYVLIMTPVFYILYGADPDNYPDKFK